MKTTNEYLDHVKKIQGIESDYSLAKVLKMSRYRVSGLRRGKDHLNAIECLRISLTGNLDLREVIAAVGLEKGDEQARQEWKMYAKKFLGQAPECVGGLMISISALVNQILAGIKQQYILCTKTNG